MKHKWEVAIASLLVLALLALPLLGCAEKAEEKVIIKLGYITDLTGPGSPVYLPMYYAIEDIARYYDEENLIPGVKIKIITYDTKYDPARDILAYDWCRERGAQVIVQCVPTGAEILQPFIERDKVPQVVMPGLRTVMEPPGWSFCLMYPGDYAIKALLKWISEQWEAAGKYDTVGKPKVGSVGVTMPYDVDLRKGIKEYCQANPDKFDYVAGFLVPTATVTWSGEVEKLKDCDYIALPGISTAEGTFVKEVRARGYTATFIGADTPSCFRGFLVDMVGWEALDGTLTVQGTLWWNESSAIIDLAKELLDRYRPEQKEDIIYAGIGYTGNFHQLYFFFDLLRQAIEEVGAENFDGQAFYNTAINFKRQYEGYPEWGFTETIRFTHKHVAVFEWKAEEGDLIRISDWLPVIE